MAASFAACSNNNIAVTATAAVQTVGSAADGDSSDAESGVASGATSGESTATPETSASTGAASSTSTGVDADTTAGNNDSSTDTTAADTTAGATASDTTAGTTAVDTDTTAADTTGDTDTTAGEMGGSPRYAVLNHCQSLDFRVADLENQWSIVTPQSPNKAAAMAVGVSNEHVYYHSQQTNVVSRYSFATGKWLPHIAGPAAIVTPRGWVEWVGGDNVCMAYGGRKELYCHDGEAWKTIMLTVSADAWASYDPVEHQIYVKVLNNAGFQVVDLDTHEIVRTVLGAPHNPYTNCLFDYHDGHVYLDRPSMLRIHSKTGASTSFQVPALEDQAGRGAGVHPSTGKVYLVSDIDFSVATPIQEYDFASKQVTLLPYEPTLGAAYRVVFQPYN